MARPASKAVANRRQLLIDAARKLFAKRLYDQVTTTEIAKSAGVAYGLIAHYFGNKRGLYRAVMNEIAVEIAAVQLPAPPDVSLADQLRHALRSHIEYIDNYSDGFVAFVRGTLGSDPDQWSAVDGLRWLGAQRILLGLGLVEPFPAVLRTAMRGWVGHLDEMMIDRIVNGGVDVDALVELAAAALVSTLRTAATLDPSITLADHVRDDLDGFTVRVQHGGPCY